MKIRGVILETVVRQWVKVTATVMASRWMQWVAMQHQSHLISYEWNELVNGAIYPHESLKESLDGWMKGTIIWPPCKFERDPWCVLFRFCFGKCIQCVSLTAFWLGCTLFFCFVCHFQGTMASMSSWGGCCYFLLSLIHKLEINLKSKSQISETSSDTWSNTILRNDGSNYLVRYSYKWEKSCENSE